MTITTGRHRAKAGEWALGKASTGTEQVAVQVQFLDLEGSPTMTWYGFFTEATTDRTLDSLRAMGWKSDDLLTMEGLGSTEFDAVVEEETDRDGEAKLRIKWINARGVMLKERMSQQEAQTFASRMRGKVLAHKQRSGGNARPAPQDTPPPPDDADAPF